VTTCAWCGEGLPTNVFGSPYCSKRSKGRADYQANRDYLRLKGG
jgi:hypothetical protein